MRNSIYIISLLAFASIGFGANSWKEGDLETLVGKSREPIEREYGSVQELRELVKIKALTQAQYEEEMKIHMKAIGDFVNFSIQNETVVNEVFEFFITTNQSVSFASKASGVFTFANVLMVIGIGVVVIGVGACITVCIVPVITNCPSEGKQFLAYCASVGILVFAKVFCGHYSQNVVACFGAIALAASYLFTIAEMRIQMSDKNEVPIIFGIVVMWGILTVIFKTQLIGFLTIAAFEAMFGFYIGIGRLSNQIGFTRDACILKAMIASGLLLGFYVVNALRILPLSPAAIEIIELFEPSVLFLGTFVFFTAILILSSRYYDTEQSLKILYIVIGIAVGLLAFYAGSLVPALSIFRGVGSTYFVIFLMQKYIEIPWGKFGELALFGGSLLFLGLCFFIKAYPELFLFT